mgnify:CR=1 FL=1|jgi:hypothetical protein
MKLRLHWAEKYETVREYPSFELDSQEYPELELEMTQVFSAETSQARDIALADLEHKMNVTQTERGETIFSMVSPSRDRDESVVYNVSDEDCGCFQVTEEE